jgi:hypothetical protein
MFSSNTKPKITSEGSAACLLQQSSIKEPQYGSFDSLELCTWLNRADFCEAQRHKLIIWRKANVLNCCSRVVSSSAELCVSQKQSSLTMFGAS